MEKQRRTCTAFDGSRCIARGDVKEVAQAVKAVVDRGQCSTALVWDDITGEVVELDLRGTVEEVLGRLPSSDRDAEAAIAPRRPGRPKLGVVAREVTLLPRHWDWLNSQPGGASVALRKLVEEARRVNEGKDRVRTAREATYRFMSAMAGDEPGYEEAIRALFSGDQEQFDKHVASWPPDVRDHARRMAAATFVWLEF